MGAWRPRNPPASGSSQRWACSATPLLPRDEEPPERSSPPGKYRTKTGFGQDAGDFRALISLNLNSSFLDRPTSAASLLHSLGELLLLRQTDANEPRHDRHGLAPAMRRLPQDVHPAAVFPR